MEEDADVSSCGRGELVRVGEPVRVVGELGKYEEAGRGLPAGFAVEGRLRRRGDFGLVGPGDSDIGLLD